MYLFYLDGEQFPVAPSKLEISIRNQSKTMTLINEGEINLLKMPGLSEISFDVLLPNQSYPFASYPDGYRDGLYYLALLERLKTSRKPFQFKVIRGASIWEDVSMDVSLEEYTITEEASTGGDFEVSIQLKQYKAYGAKKLESLKKADGTPLLTVDAVRSTKAPAQSCQIAKGDTLWLIAKRELGNGERWQEIYNLNKDAIEAAAKANGKPDAMNGTLVFPGTMLKLPQ